MKYNTFANMAIILFSSLLLYTGCAQKNKTEDSIKKDNLETVLIGPPEPSPYQRNLALRDSLKDNGWKFNTNMDVDLDDLEDENLYFRLKMNRPYDITISDYKNSHEGEGEKYIIVDLYNPDGTFNEKQKSIFIPKSSK